MKITPMRSITIAALGLAGLVAGTAAHAQSAKGSVDKSAQLRANLDASMKAAAQGQRVGMLSGKADPQPVVQADGTVSQELDAGSMSYTVARRNADGSIEMVCVNGAEAAQKALKAPPSATSATSAKRSSQVAKEQTHVK